MKVTFKFLVDNLTRNRYDELNQKYSEEEIKTLFKVFIDTQIDYRYNQVLYYLLGMESSVDASVEENEELLGDSIRILRSPYKCKKFCEFVGLKFVECSVEDLPFGNTGKIEDLNLSVRTTNCLKRSGVDTIEKLYSLKLIEIKNLRNLGKRSFSELLTTLGRYNKPEPFRFEDLPLDEEN